MQTISLKNIFKEVKSGLAGNDKYISKESPEIKFEDMAAPLESADVMRKFKDDGDKANN